MKKRKVLSSNIWIVNTLQYNEFNLYYCVNASQKNNQIFYRSQRGTVFISLLVLYCSINMTTIRINISIAFLGNYGKHSLFFFLSFFSNIHVRKRSFSGVAKSCLIQWVVYNVDEYLLNSQSDSRFSWKLLLMAKLPTMVSFMQRGPLRSHGFSGAYEAKPF